ncbi:MAG: ATP-binding protein [Bacteroidales bacterium]|nr:ATP-binding protein [Bacteroidales bacterium]
MGYKHFYKAILLRLTLLVLITIIGAYLFFEQQAYWFSAIVAIVLLGVMANLINYFNHINKWIALFLLGIENEDTTLKTPMATGNKAIDDVYIGMNRLNEMFRQTKIDISTQEQYFRTLINQSATGLFSINENGRVININPSAKKLTNLNDQHHINALISIDKALPDFIMQRGHKSNLQSAIFENKQGQKLLFKPSEINTNNQTIKLVAVSDITKELDTREVDAWVKLARTLSHEIMNNIAPITTLSQVISGYFTKNNQPVGLEKIDLNTIANTIKGLRVIEERSLGLMNFVENYRKFTKLPEPHFKEIILSDLIESDLLAAAAFHGFGAIKVEKSIPQNIVVQSDRELLSQVIINLLKNATEALYYKDIVHPTMIVKLVQTDRVVKIEISNNGPAIPPEIREQIFVPFYTTKENGSGIGLSLSKQIMLRMGGDILLVSSIDSWTTFAVVI